MGPTVYLPLQPFTTTSPLQSIPFASPYPWPPSAPILFSSASRSSRADHPLVLHQDLTPSPSSSPHSLALPPLLSITPAALTWQGCHSGVECWLDPTWAMIGPTLSRSMIGLSQQVSDGVTRRYRGHGSSPFSLLSLSLSYSSCAGLPWGAATATVSPGPVPSAAGTAAASTATAPVPTMASLLQLSR
jgi:hypothetical protein